MISFFITFQLQTLFLYYELWKSESKIDKLNKRSNKEEEKW